MGDEPVLYHMPQSFYSQVARLALVEKGVRFAEKIVLAGPPTCETYEPWYMKLNPNGTAPTLAHNGRAVPGSLEIAEYAEKTFAGAPLLPADAAARAEAERWVEAFRAFPFAVLLYGNEKMRAGSAFIYGMRLRRLKALAAKHPDLAPLYEAKAQSVREDAGNSADGEHILALRARLVAMLDELDGLLAGRQWIAGDAYSLADVVWTVVAAQLIQEGKVDVTGGRPNLARWLAALRRRPSYQTADIWDRIKVGRTFAVVASRLPHYMAGFLLALAAICAGLWWLAGLLF